MFLEKLFQKFTFRGDGEMVAVNNAPLPAERRRDRKPTTSSTSPISPIVKQAKILKKIAAHKMDDRKPCKYSVKDLDKETQKIVSKFSMESWEHIDRLLIGNITDVLKGKLYIPLKEKKEKTPEIARTPDGKIDYSKPLPFSMAPRPPRYKPSWS